MLSPIIRLSAGDHYASRASSDSRNQSIGSARILDRNTHHRPGKLLDKTEHLYYPMVSLIPNQVKPRCRANRYEKPSIFNKLKNTLCRVRFAFRRSVVEPAEGLPWRPEPSGGQATQFLVVPNGRYRGRLGQKCVGDTAGGLHEARN